VRFRCGSSGGIGAACGAAFGLSLIVSLLSLVFVFCLSLSRSET
jgi:hypothetical protein